MYRVRQVKVLVEDNDILKAISKKINVRTTDIKNYKILKQSIDARKKESIYYVYEVVVDIDIKLKLNNDVLEYVEEKYEYPIPGTKELNNRPIIVGSGPSGLFCGLVLSRLGYKPIILERGEDIDNRINSVNTLWSTGKLNPNSNIQFGLGGAGTFSDGKLNTLIKDSNNRMKFVYEEFVSHGAKEDILYSYKPHVGTDILVNVVKNIKDEIISLGGEFRFNTCLTDINITNNKIDSIVVNNKDIINTDILVLALGHSSRDTFRMLNDRNINMESKPFAVGLRVIHSQDMINLSQYGEKYKDMLGSAPYKLTYKCSNGRGVYSFCMCPGGYVVNASSEENRLVVNGMSYSGRDSTTANSAIVVSIYPRDYGTNLFDGVKFQEELESKAFNIGKGKVPIQLYKDFIDDKESDSLGSVDPNIKGEYTFSNLNSLLPTELNDSIKEAFIDFNKKIKGFSNPDTILVGVESRTSSPIRILRDDNFISNINGIYPCGEGAGYAGGITSASIDGVKIAEAIIKEYRGSYED